ncbi:c-type cytochrome biogenesis protein CcmI [Tardiphaga sp. P9-11]|jgi:cytochrome c-type biogenesis protein CcmH|uniref:c-type cytochrome biogenesis protein CcmI n=1 Tax=Tardiphaga sp. P9-11 TaxID=2024614 RepID=UPI0011F1488C|nr:c-type cytochrome biogenesis protein CcmI [Tardiphaga sp. P9-11]KAA0076344.1 c-type cytochrome biogenesis protein CcmI [Tardiphaga sp. P9-11]
MALWFVFALMTAAAIFAVLWPLGRTRSDAGGTEASVYRDQLAEITRDTAAGLIGPTEAEAARVEISRRLLAAVDAEGTASVGSSPGFRRAVSLLALIGLPLLAIGFYLPLGSPAMPDFPLAARNQSPSPTQPLNNLVAQVEQHLEKNPTDGRGWTVLAPVLAKIGRTDDAVRAFRNAITYAGDTAARRADLGEAMAMAANGVITADAKAEFERAVALDAGEAKARYFLGLAAEQDGRGSDAAAIWRDMLAKGPADAPWRPVVTAALARVGGGNAPTSGPNLPALSQGTIASVQGMNAGDRNAMVQGMVDRLATRLKQDGSDVEGWLRLVRAYMVLGERDKAKSALADAREAVGTDAERLRKLNDGLKDSGLDG